MATSNGRYDAVTLDMGFTLVNLDSGYDRTLLAMAHNVGHSITLDAIHSAQHVFWQEFTAEDATRTWEPTIANDDAIGQEIDRRICEKLGITDAAFLAEFHLRARRAFHDPATYTVFPEVCETLKALRRTVPRLGILSNWGWHLPELCEQLGLASYFDFIVVSARVGCSKPAPGRHDAGTHPARGRQPERGRARRPGHGHHRRAGGPSRHSPAGRLSGGAGSGGSVGFAVTW
jgi:FMN phosphatase YigB (HAD superfamily)